MTIVKWQYTHYLNSRSSFEAIKTGEYLGKVKHKTGSYGLQMAKVLFEGNKTISIVPYSELEFV